MKKTTHIAIAKTWTVLGSFFLVGYFAFLREFLVELRFNLSPRFWDSLFVFFLLLVTFVTRRGLTYEEVQFWGRRRKKAEDPQDP